MPTPPSARSVKISADERGGWSSDRPRRDGAPPRPADVSVRGRVLTPSERLVYSPGSLLVVVSASPAKRDALLERVLEDRGVLLAESKVLELLRGRVGEDELRERALEVLRSAAQKRLSGGDTTVIAADGLAPEEREVYVRMAAPLRRPRHLLLLETGRDEVPEEDRSALNELRRRLDAQELGAEGFHTSLRLGGGAATELKRIVFRSAPRDDD
jgi:predicted kinase